MDNRHFSFVFVQVADLLNNEMCFSHPKNAVVLPAFAMANCTSLFLGVMPESK
ncbi:hypothetical protein DPMN_156946 [Dreissena polymorpha]|uniref:Uncharacterized protein n=1 Tax=Dreissena polymorpha TaxID=45954 RepID=A0A9D4FPV0_DREPO|nr:hypothetical protein DPMN_156946 [Dreissena polymorpha]